MEKKLIIAISIFFLIVVIGVGIYYFSSSRGEHNITDQNDSQLKITPSIKKLSCDDIKDVKEKEVCQAGVVKLLNSDNSSVCDGLIADADKNSCRQAYIIKQVVSSGDLNKCREATSEAMVTDCSAQASFSLAIQKKDKKYCNNIINKTDKANCLKVLAGMGVK